MEQAATSECEEHVMEQAHYAVENVSEKSLQRFEALVDEISSALGRPEYNASTDSQDKDCKNPMPKWVTGTRHGESSRKIMRLSYWKRENGISYVMLRQELDSKDRPKYFDLVVGARKRVRSATPKVDKARYQDTSIMGWIKRLFSSGRTNM